MLASWIWILVFPWIQVLAQTCISSYSQPSTKLQGHAIKTYSAVQTSDQCINKCALHADCHSINYCSSQGICEVNNANHLTNPESLVFSAGFQYLNYILRGVSRCSNKLCNYPNQCAIDSTTEQGYKCGLSGCGSKILSYPKELNKDKVEYNMTVKSLTAFTLSMWVQADPSSSSNIPFSYSTDDKDEIMIYLRQSDSFFYLGTNPKKFSSLNDGQWHHVCGTWENVHGNLVVYINGKIKASEAGLNKNHTIEKGNVVFAPQKIHTFKGNLTGVNMWDRVFTAQEVSGIANRCSSSQGNIFKWADLQDKSYGNVLFICERFCPS